MKIYVDEMPKSCAKCIFYTKEDIKSQHFRHCLIVGMGWDCPLHLIEKTAHFIVPKGLHGVYECTNCKRRYDSTDYEQMKYNVCFGCGAKIKEGK